MVGSVGAEAVLGGGSGLPYKGSREASIKPAAHYLSCRGTNVASSFSDRNQNSPGGSRPETKEAPHAWSNVGGGGPAGVGLGEPGSGPGAVLDTASRRI